MKFRARLSLDCLESRVVLDGTGVPYIPPPPPPPVYGDTLPPPPGYGPGTSTPPGYGPGDPNGPPPPPYGY